MRLQALVLVPALVAGGISSAAADVTRCGRARATIVGTGRSDVLTGTNGRDVIVARGGDDWIRSLDGNDVICGDAGFDFVRAGGGRDHVRGGGGSDTLRGGPGADVLRAEDGAVEALFGEAGRDTLEGGPGDFDGLIGGAGDDVLDGGPGLDTAQLWDAPGPVSADLAAGTATGHGDDRLVAVEGVVGSNFDDVLTGDDGSNLLSAQAGEDTINALGSGTLSEGTADLIDGGEGNDLLYGGEGADVVAYDDSRDPVTVDLGAARATGSGTDTLESIEAAVGSDNDDVLRGDANANAFAGGPGDDDLDGRDGDDLLLGEVDDDTAHGGSGTDECDAETEQSCENDPAARTVAALSGWAGAEEAPPPVNGRIAFVRNTDNRFTDVASLQPGARGYTPITNTRPNELYVDVSPNGKWVAFTRSSKDGSDIYKAPIGGGKVVRLTSDGVDDELPIWSPDSRRIAFVRYAGGEDGEIFVMDADGSDRRRITDNDTGDADPRWSPDGTQLVYNGGDVDEGAQDVFVVTLANLQRRNLTPDPGINDTFAEWSPDGNTVVYSSFREDQWDLYKVPVDGGDAVRLTDDLADDYAAEWSPDGSMLLFVRGRLEGNDPPDEVHVMNADGTGDRSISPARLQAFSPDWSPDGRKIVFVGQVPTAELPEWELFTVDVDGSNLTRLTRTAAEEFDPEWAPAPR